jgi:hypothetical protein
VDTSADVLGNLGMIFGLSDLMRQIVDGVQQIEVFFCKVDHVYALPSALA